ncbi:hypothetical protein [Winogradskya humida]|uniref:Uncharacterized protein n=1 Tax=Winogradskya humida TaxID=113566 RepID=A0ABQ3ZQ94_9ACTN|nr:hypothetical protein [Actinoplanes humidus]GIE20755.1 hypothetical protein Ahu01nite_038570 [Actinoplanes humidus]
MTGHALTCLNITQTAGGMHRRGTPPRLNGGGSPPGLCRRHRPLRTEPLLTWPLLTWPYLTCAHLTGPPLDRGTLTRTLLTLTLTLLAWALLTLTLLAGASLTLLARTLLARTLLARASLACSLLVRVGAGLIRRTLRGYRPDHRASGRPLFRLPRARNAPRTANRTRGRPADLRNLPGIADDAGRSTGHRSSSPGNGRSANTLTPRHHRRHHRGGSSHRRSTGSTGRNRTGVPHLAGFLAPVRPPVSSALLSGLPIGPRPAAGGRSIPRPEGAPVRPRHSRNRPARPTRRPDRPTTDDTPSPSKPILRRSPPPTRPSLRRSPPPSQTFIRRGTTPSQTFIRRGTTPGGRVIRGSTTPGHPVLGSRTTAGGSVIGGRATAGRCIVRGGTAAATGESFVLGRAAGELLVGGGGVATTARSGSVDHRVAARGRILGEGPGGVTTAEASRRALLGILMARGTTRCTVVGALVAARATGRRDRASRQRLVRACAVAARGARALGWRVPHTGNLGCVTRGGDTRSRADRRVRPGAVTHRRIPTRWSPDSGKRTGLARVAGPAELPRVELTTSLTRNFRIGGSPPADRLVPHSPFAGTTPPLHASAGFLLPRTCHRRSTRDTTGRHATRNSCHARHGNARSTTRPGTTGLRTTDRTTGVRPTTRTRHRTARSSTRTRTTGHLGARCTTRWGTAGRTTGIRPTGNLGAAGVRGAGHLGAARIRGAGYAARVKAAGDLGAGCAAGGEVAGDWAGCCAAGGWGAAAGAGDRAGCGGGWGGGASGGRGHAGGASGRDGCCRAGACDRCAWGCDRGRSGAWAGGRLGARGGLGVSTLLGVRRGLRGGGRGRCGGGRGG